jgi:hypothetical protein
MTDACQWRHVILATLISPSVRGNIVTLIKKCDAEIKQDNEKSRLTLPFLFVNIVRMWREFCSRIVTHDESNVVTFKLILTITLQIRLVLLLGELKDCIS